MAVESMTGFGKASATDEGLTITVEARSVNHRFLDVTCKVPGIYALFEHDVIGCVREEFGRGRVEISISRVDLRSGTEVVQFHAERFHSYWNAVTEALRSVGVKSAAARDQALVELLTRRDVIESSSVTVDEVNEKKLLLNVCKAALSELRVMRQREGRNLQEEIGRLLGDLEQAVKGMRLAADASTGLFRERLSARLEKLAPDVAVPPERLAQEVALLAERTDITEELARLESHIGQYRVLLKSEHVGRKLDFLAQEIGREINTCGSKAQSTAITREVVEAKAVMEKIREQVQNIE